MEKTKKILLPENEIPHQWYNIVADMKNKPQPMLDPKTHQPVTVDALSHVFASELAKQELSEERWIDIPDEVRDLYKIYRPTPLVRAYGLEKALDTPARIYFKNESVSPVGSHKLNSAIPQVYFNKIQGIKNVTTETGAGQWGCALSLAGQHFGINVKVFMVKVSAQQKPYRRSIMQTFGAQVFASPSTETEAGRKILAEDPECTGSLGIAISEAIESALKQPDTRYTLGSVLSHVALHQTIIGLEAEKQLDMAGEYPDVVIACFGGGSNFGGCTFPFIRHNLVDGKQTKFIAAEPASCPKLTRGEFHYDYGDTAGFTPLIPMYTLGHDFLPASIHAGGLRYHGAGAIISQLLKDKYFEARDVKQLDSFAAGTLFARAEGIVPAPESTHAIAVAVEEALKAKEEGKQKTILFNLSGHGLIDMSAYDAYNSGQMTNYVVDDADIQKTLKQLDNI
jgi:tryptophan synthase beta chain